MKIEEYLAQYDRDLIRSLTWLKSNGVNVLSAMSVIQSYADEEKIFESGSALDQSILIESLKKEVNPLRDFIDAVNLLKTQNSLHEEITDSSMKFHRDIKNSYDSMEVQYRNLIKDLKDINDTKQILMESIGFLNNDLKVNSKYIADLTTSLVVFQGEQTEKTNANYQRVLQPVLDLIEVTTNSTSEMTNMINELREIKLNLQRFMEWSNGNYNSFFEFVNGIQSRIANDSSAVLNNSSEIKNTLDMILSLKEKFTGDTSVLRSLVESEMGLIEIIDKSRQAYVGELDRIKNVFVQSLQTESDIFRKLSRDVRDDMIALRKEIEEIRKCWTQNQ